jgi:predicted 2-oxoglutarate/Fe(II)-dependent dioxygenase YbiX
MLTTPDQEKMMKLRQHSDSVLADAARGALAGAAATWVMGQVTSYLYEQEAKEARRQEDEAREGKTAYGVAAEKAAEAVGQELSKEQRKQVGSAIHWGLGVGAGAAYGALRGRVPC